MDSSFKETHKKGKASFTRNRSLTFERTCLGVFLKSVKSLSNHIYELFDSLPDWNKSFKHLPSASAFSQARLKLMHTAFIELDRECVIKPFYEYSKDQKRWNGFRLNAIDGSLVNLPDSKDIRKEFGVIKGKNHHSVEAKGHSQGRISVCYDVLNHFVRDAKITDYYTSEVPMAHEHINSCTTAEDLYLMDRGYGGFEIFALIMYLKGQFCCRCQRQNFKVIDEIFEADEEGVDRIVTLKANSAVRKKLKKKKMYLGEIKVRLISVRLCTGELEVLATSLLSQEEYPWELFGELYNLRWGVETYYARLKGRLDLELFTGKSSESVYQDFYACIFISNLESLLTKEEEKEFEKHANKPKSKCTKQINHASSFNAIKHNVIEIILTDEDLDVMLERLHDLFRRKILYEPLDKPNPPRKSQKKFKKGRIVKTYKSTF